MGLLGLRPGNPLPQGGQRIAVMVQSGSGSADAWTKMFGPAFERCGITLYPGSLNLWAAEEIFWDNPVTISTSAGTGEFCPVILEECAVGVAFRKNTETPRYLETLAPVRLRDRLNLSDGQRMSVRLLPGRALDSCLART